MNSKVRVLKDGYLETPVGKSVTVENVEYLRALYHSGVVEDADGPNSLKIAAEAADTEPGELNVEQITAGLKAGTLEPAVIREAELARPRARKGVMEALESLEGSS